MDAYIKQFCQLNLNDPGELGSWLKTRKPDVKFSQIVSYCEQGRPVRYVGICADPIHPEQKHKWHIGLFDELWEPHIGLPMAAMEGDDNAEQA